MLRVPRLLALVLGIGLAGLGAGCDVFSSASDGPGDEEFISDLTLTLTSDQGEKVVRAAANEVGVIQEVDTLRLTSGTTYEGQITLRNRFMDEDVTAEIKDEAESHRFFFFVRGLAGIAVNPTDRESDYGPNDEGEDLPVGLQFTLTTERNAAGNGTLRVQLAHYANGPKEPEGDRNDPPALDIDVAFPLAVTRS
jgi:hypothetical protein